MNILEKNKGPKLAYGVNGSRLTFGDDEITLDLAKYEQDWPQHIDVLRDRAGCLVTSFGSAIDKPAYAAQIDIPARGYREVPAPADSACDGGDPGTVLEPEPFSMDNVTLTLWALL